MIFAKCLLPIWRLFARARLMSEVTLLLSLAYYLSESVYYCLSISSLNPKCSNTLTGVNSHFCSWYNKDSRENSCFTA